jgi:predicted lipoprotein with Yx(FWY)xxD motif
MRAVSVIALLAAAAVAALATSASAAPVADAGETTLGTAATKTLTVRSTRFGRILFDGRGRALYAFTRDQRGGPSRCYGDCAAAWPVYFKRGVLTAGTGVKRSMLGTTRRRDGRLQITYNGWPLYYYAHEQAGQVKCQNVVTHGGTWLVVAPSGKLVR